MADSAKRVLAMLLLILASWGIVALMATSPDEPFGVAAIVAIIVVGVFIAIGTILKCAHYLIVGDDS